MIRDQHGCLDIIIQISYRLSLEVRLRDHNWYTDRIYLSSSGFRHVEKSEQNQSPILRLQSILVGWLTIAASTNV